MGKILFFVYNNNELNFMPLMFIVINRVPRTQQKNWVKKLWTEKNWGKLSTRKKNWVKSKVFLPSFLPSFLGYGKTG
jgi:hypothetical protein